MVVNLWPSHGVPILCILMGGTSGRAMGSSTQEANVAWVMPHLRSLFGDAGVPEPLKVVQTDWANDPFSYGAYSCAAATMRPDDQRVRPSSDQPVDMLVSAGPGRCHDCCPPQLHSPLRVVTSYRSNSNGSTPVLTVGDVRLQVLGDPAGKVYFAGEATSVNFWGCVHGAILTGLREARRITGDDSIMTKASLASTKRAHKKQVLLRNFMRFLAGNGADKLKQVLTCFLMSNLRNEYQTPLCHHCGERVMLLMLAGYAISSDM